MGQALHSLIALAGVQQTVIRMDIPRATQRDDLYPIPHRTPTHNPQEGLRAFRTATHQAIRSENLMVPPSAGATEPQIPQPTATAIPYRIH